MSDTPTATGQPADNASTPKPTMADKTAAAVAATFGELGITPEELSGETPPPPPKKTTVPPEKPAEELPKEELPKEEEPKKETEEEFHKPTAEDLAIIQGNPQLSKVYKSLQRGFTQARQRDSDKLRAAETAVQQVEQIRKSPAAAIKALADVSGIKVTIHDAENPPKEGPTVEERIHASLAKRLGKDAADVLAPALAESVQPLIKEQVAPLEAAREESQTERRNTMLATALQAYRQSKIDAKEEWNPEIDKEMGALITSGSLVPGPGATFQSYLDSVYNAVMAPRLRAATTTRALERIKRAPDGAEPVGQKPPAKASKRDRSGMTVEEQNRDAVREALDEMGVEGA